MAAKCNTIKHLKTSSETLATILINKRTMSSDYSVPVQNILCLPIFNVISVGVGFGFPECESRMLPGFRSRCTIPFEFKAFIAQATISHTHTVAFMKSLQRTKI